MQENGTLGGGVLYTEGVVYPLDDAEVTREKYLEDFTSPTTRAIQITVTPTSTTLYYYCTTAQVWEQLLMLACPIAEQEAERLAEVQVLHPAIQHPLILVQEPWYNSATGYLYVYVDDGDSPIMVQS